MQDVNSLGCGTSAVSQHIAEHISGRLLDSQGDWGSLPSSPGGSPRQTSDVRQGGEEFIEEGPSQVGEEVDEAETDGAAQWRSTAVGRLKHYRKTDDELEGVRYRATSHYNARTSRQIMDFYERQNEVISNFDEVDDLLLEVPSRSSVEIDISEVMSGQYRNRVAMWLSFGMNCILLVVKCVAYAYSGSLSILASTIDSFLDIVAGAILFLTAVSEKRGNKYRFPIGNKRMQPLGIIVFSSIMGTVGCQVLIEAVRQLVGNEHTHHLEDLILLVAIMASVIVVKFFLWLFCRSSKDPSVQTYAQDHINDVGTNIVGLAGALLGDKAIWWIDPLAAIVLSLYIIRCWTLTCIENFKAMMGLSAPPGYIAKLTYLCCNFHPEIKQVDTVRAYTFGPQLFVEVDVVLSPSMPLQNAHDIGEKLQQHIESFPEVERAFVHLDYNFTHRPEHDNKIHMS